MTAINPTIPQELRTQVADYVALRMFDINRTVAGHDYGSGQRSRELTRRFNQLWDALYAHGGLELAQAFNTKDGLSELVTMTDLQDAYARVIAPRAKRVRSEPGAQYRTPASQKAAQAFRRTASDLGL